MNYSNLKKVFLGGYSKTSVQTMISDFKLENQRLKDKIKSQDNVIETLKEKISRYESKDVLVSEVLVEAKHVAKNMIKDAHDKVDNLRSDSENELSEKLSQFDATMSELESIRSGIIVKESQLREELKTVINSYLEHIENIDLSVFSDLVNEINKDVQSIELIKDQVDIKSQDESTKSNVVEIHPKCEETAPLVDVPIYDLNEIIRR